MANTVNIQLLVDGPKNVVAKIDGFVDTSDLALTTLLDPATLSTVFPNQGLNGAKATLLRVNKIIYDVEDLLSLNLAFDGATPAPIWHLVGRGQVELDKKFGGLQNNAVAPTGKITAVTQGWSAAAILSFTIWLECTKQYAPPM